MLTRKITKGKLGDLTFQLNPTTLQYDGGIEWVPINSPNMPNPLWQSGNAKPHTISFELYINEKANIDVNIEEFLNTLRKYRGSREAIIFSYGKNYINRVIVANMSIIGSSYNSLLNITEARISIMLNVIF